MAADPKALETIKENQKTIDQLTALQKTVQSFGEKANQLSNAFREHFKAKLDPTQITDKEKLTNDANAAVKRLQMELKEQIQAALMETKRVRAEGPRGPKRLRKII